MFQALSGTIDNIDCHIFGKTRHQEEIHLNFELRNHSAHPRIDHIFQKWVSFKRRTIESLGFQQLMVNPGSGESKTLTSLFPTVFWSSNRINNRKVSKLLKVQWVFRHVMLVLSLKFYPFFFADCTYFFRCFSGANPNCWQHARLLRGDALPCKQGTPVVIPTSCCHSQPKQFKRRSVDYFSPFRIVSKPDFRRKVVANHKVRWPRCRVEKGPRDLKPPRPRWITSSLHIPEALKKRH